MTAPRDPLRGTGRVVAAASIAAIVALTLHPAAGYHDLGQPGFCLLCGRYGLANVLRNVILFVPLGLGLELATRRARLAAGGGALLSVAIELAQLFVPGRNPLVADVLANATGAGLGVLLALALRARVAPSHAGPARMLAVAWLAAGIGVGVLAGTAVAFQIAPPAPPHHVQWTPHLDHMEPYGGRVLEASLAGETLPPGRHPEPGVLEDRLLGGATLRVAFTPGAPPYGVAPILSVFTAARREVFLLGAQGEDLVVRLPFRAAELRLDRPDLRLPAALSGIRGEQSVEAAARVSHQGVCLEIAEVSRCGLRHTLGEGWSLLLFPRWASGRARIPMNLLWLGALAFLPAFFAPSWRTVAATGILLVASAMALPAITDSFARAPPGDLFALACGALLGYAAARRVGPRVTARRPETVAASQRRGDASPGGSHRGHDARKPLPRSSPGTEPA